MSDRKAPVQKQIYICWTRYQRRPASMQQRIGFKIYFVTTKIYGKKLKSLDYALKALKTLAILWREKPDVLWVGVAPIFVAQVAFIFRALTFSRFQVIIDCHNSTFERLWITLPFARQTLRAAACCLVHNEEVLADAKAAGLPDDQVFVLEDRPAERSPPSQSEGVFRVPQGPYIICPCGFLSDEPIEAVIDAGRLMAPISLYLTGDDKRVEDRSIFANAAPNVHVTGFLSLEDFETMLSHAAAALGVTTREGTQMSVANEAVGFGRPMVLSGNRIMRELFPQGAIFVDNTAESIAEGCRRAVADGARLEADVVAMRSRRLARWESQLTRVFERLGTVVGRG